MSLKYLKENGIDLEKARKEARQIINSNNLCLEMVLPASELILTLCDELQQLREEAERFKSTLDDIAGICVNYDGYTTVEGLQGLIDDIGDMAARAVNGEESK